GESARELWTQMATTGEHEWIREAARRGLAQLDAENHIELLQRAVNSFYDEHGRFPASWKDLILSRQLRNVPMDPEGWPYTLNPVSGEINVSQKSSLFPLPGRRLP